MDTEDSPSFAKTGPGKGIECSVADARVRRGSEVRTVITNTAEHIAGCIVLHQLHSYRIANRAEKRKRFRGSAIGDFLQLVDIGKQNLLFLQHVIEQVLLQSDEHSLDLDEFGMRLSVHRNDFREQRLDPAEFLSVKSMVRIENVCDKRC